MKIKDYKVLKSDEHEDLQRRVLELAFEGYQPLGGITSTTIARRYAEGLTQTFYAISYAQAMVLYEKT